MADDDPEDLEGFWADLRPRAAPPARARRSSPIFCEHANEMPQTCPCDADCYCKAHSCRPPSSDPRLCGHANEVPHICPCPANCFCKSNTCRPREREHPLYCGCRACSGSY